VGSGGGVQEIEISSLVFSPPRCFLLTSVREGELKEVTSGVQKIIIVFHNLSRTSIAKKQRDEADGSAGANV
jgi:hypothetical protein